MIFPNNQQQPNLRLTYFLGGMILYGIYGLYKKIGPFESDNHMLNELTDKINQCPSAKQLWEEVNEENPINLALTSDGDYSLNNRTINIDRFVPAYKKVEYLLQGLCELKHPDTNSTEALQFGQKEFVNKLFSEFYDQKKCHHDIAAACVKNSNWDSIIDYYKYLFDRKEDVSLLPKTEYQFFITEPGIKNYKKRLSEIWNDFGKIPYCEKNPQAPECT